MRILLTHRTHSSSAGAALVRGIEAAGAGSRLRHLDLTNCRLSDGAAAALGRALAVQGPTGSLRTLDLVFNAVGPAGAGRLADGLRSNSCLERLNLHCNLLGAEGAAAIAAGLAGGIGGGGRPSVSQLRALRLSENGIENGGVAAMLDAGLQDNTTLTRLELNGNGIGDEGGLALARWAADRFLGAGGPPRSGARRHEEMGSAGAAEASDAADSSAPGPSSSAPAAVAEDHPSGGAHPLALELCEPRWKDEPHALSDETRAAIWAIVDDVNAAAPARGWRRPFVQQPRRRAEEDPELRVRVALLISDIDGS